MSAALLTEGALVSVGVQGEESLGYSRQRRNALADIFHEVDAGLVSQLCQRCAGHVQLDDVFLASPQAEKASRVFNVQPSSDKAASNKTSRTSSSSSSCNACCKHRTSDGAVATAGKTGPTDRSEQAHLLASRSGVPSSNARVHDTVQDGLVLDISRLQVRAPNGSPILASHQSHAANDSSKTIETALISAMKPLVIQAEKKNPLLRTGSCSDNQFHAQECAKRSLVF
jgi:hypothetical protein